MKTSISKLVRQNILKMKGYSSARDEYTGTASIYLDANESPYGQFNRYPDPYQKELKSKISNVKSIPSKNIFVGNGSDEAIDLLMRIFCNPSTDNIISFTPGYGMYQVSASIQDINNISLPLNEKFQIDREILQPYLDDISIKIIFICSPNNPTGNLINKEDIDWILDSFNGIVVIDEAYIDFANTVSWISQVNNYERLVVLQTMSKAWGLAAARVGMAYADEDIISLFNKVKPPYNVSNLNQKAAVAALTNKKVNRIKVEATISERKRLKKEILKLPNVKKIFPSEANFLFMEVDDADKIYLDLINQKIIVRNQTNKVKDCLRISIGTPEENNRLIEILKSINDPSLQLTEYGLNSTPDLINRH